MGTSRICLALAFFASGSAFAEAKPAPLQTLPADKLQALAPLLRSNDLALIESGDKGVMKQLTTVTLVAAPAAEVRDVVIHPERYGQFVRNMKESTVKPEPGGTLFHSYAINYTIYTVDGRHRYVFDKEGAGGGPPAVEMYDPDSNGVRHYRWEFLPVGSATLLVLYGFTVVPRDGFMSKFLNQAPSLEYGLALIPQLTLALAVKERTVALRGGKREALPSGDPGSYDFLLDRGTVALLRTAAGRLSDISLIDRTTAKPDALVKVASEPIHWANFMPTIHRSTPLGNVQGMSGVELEQSLPLMSWTSTFAYKSEPGAVDLFGVSGDLHGTRFRWDVRARDATHSELVLRAIQHYEQGSMVVHELYKLEPLFEYGVDVGLGLVQLQAVRARAEQLTTSRATR